MSLVNNSRFRHRLIVAITSEYGKLLERRMKAILIRNCGCAAIVIITISLLLDHNRNSMTYKQRMRLQHGLEIAQQHRLLDNTGRLARFITVSPDRWNLLFNAAEKWLDLPYFLSSTFYDGREQMNYEICRAAARESNPQQDGRPRDS